MVCLDRIDDGWVVHDAVLDVIHSTHGKIGTLVGVPLPAVVAGQDAVTYTLRLNSGREFTEWHFARGGWAYAVGVVCFPTELDDAYARGKAVLDTWEWLSPASD